MPDAVITVQIEGIEEDGGAIRLTDFLEELTAVRNALRQTERIVLKSEDRAVEYKVIKLSQASPATVTIGIAPRDPVYIHTPQKISKRFTTSLRMVRRGHRFASNLDSRTLETFQGINAPTKKHISRVTVTGENNQSIQIDQQFERSLQRLLEGDVRERDEIVGKLERLDIHNKTHFDIYPIIGSPRIRCTASKSLQEKIVACGGRWVSVDGWALYRKDSPFPYAMKVEDISLRKKDEELPLLSSLHGIAPNATDGEVAEDFVRELRNAYW
jgi:hypothetical protein